MVDSKSSGEPSPMAFLGDIEKWLREHVMRRMEAARDCAHVRWRHQATPMAMPSGVAYEIAPAGGVTPFASFTRAAEAVHAALNDPADAMARCQFELALLDGGTVRAIVTMSRAYRHREGWRPEWDRLLETLKLPS